MPAREKPPALRVDDYSACKRKSVPSPTGLEARRGSCYNDDKMAECRKAFRRAALRLSKTAMLFCHIVIARSIAHMMDPITRLQTCRLEEKTIEYSIVFSMRWSI